jgi:uncharacterized alkaline shock family protein YloU
MTDPPEPKPADAMNGMFTRETLACGADVDELLEQVADGHGGQLTAHQSQCVHCQAAIREFTRLWAPVRQLADTPVPTPAELAAAVVDRVRGLVRDVWYTLEVTDGGAIRIAARVVATLARDAARRVPAVHVALGRSTGSKVADRVEKATLRHRHPHAAVGVLGRTAVVDLAVAVAYGEPVHEIARQVQHDVISELRDNVGLQSITVNVTVDDVIAPPRP